MTARKKGAGYFVRLMRALAGLETIAPPPSNLEAASQAAGLTLELDERDRRIEAMQREYAALSAARDRAAAGSGQEQLERLFKKLAGPLSNLAALADLFESGQQVTAEDLVHLLRTVEKELARAGLERAGKTGETAAFDPAIHQRMSGGTVHPGARVVVRVPGFKMGEKVLMKAMVTTREE